MAKNTPSQIYFEASRHRRFSLSLQFCEMLLKRGVERFIHKERKKGKERKGKERKGKDLALLRTRVVARTEETPAQVQFLKLKVLYVPRRLHVVHFSAPLCHRKYLNY